MKKAGIVLLILMLVAVGMYFFIAKKYLFSSCYTGGNIIDIMALHEMRYSNFVGDLGNPDNKIKSGDFFTAKWEDCRGFYIQAVFENDELFDFYVRLSNYSISTFLDFFKYFNVDVQNLDQLIIKSSGVETSTNGKVIFLKDLWGYKVVHFNNYSRVEELNKNLENGFVSELRIYVK